MKFHRRLLVAFSLVGASWLFAGCSSGNPPPTETIAYYDTLINPGFENGDLNGWGSYVASGSSAVVAIVTSPVQNGSYALQLHSATTPSQSNAAAWQEMPFSASGSNVPKAGDKVKAEAWIYVGPEVDLSLGNFELRLEAIVPGDKIGLAKFTTTSIFKKGEWICVSTQSIGDGVIPVTATSLVVAVENPICPASGPGAGDIFVDDVKVGAIQ